jgi:hypothetical protein
MLRNFLQRLQLSLLIFQVVTVAALSCIGEFSHANNYSKRIMDLYLYATGAQRQAITVLSTIGLSESYTNLTSKNIKRCRKKKDAGDSEVQLEGDMSFKLSSDAVVTRTGTLHQLSESMRARAREIAATGLYLVVYDNINIQLRTAEQIIGRHGL